MSEDKVPVIAAKVEELKAEFQRLQDFLQKTETAIKQLNTEREQTIANLNQVSGAHKAYSDIVNFLGGAPAVADAVVAAETVANVIEGEVVKEE